VTYQYKKEGSWCNIYFLFISITNLYMFLADLLLVIRRCYSVGRIGMDPANSQSTYKHNIYQLLHFQSATS
jgi:hypothetical protein